MKNGGSCWWGVHVGDLPNWEGENKFVDKTKKNKKNKIKKQNKKKKRGGYQQIEYSSLSVDMYSFGQ